MKKNTNKIFFIFKFMYARQNSVKLVHKGLFKKVDLLTQLQIFIIHVLLCIESNIDFLVFSPYIISGNKHYDIF